MPSEKLHLLFVCGRNQWRSPTAARLYANDPRVDARAAGLSPQIRRGITEGDVKWADLVLVMEKKHKSRILERFNHLDLPPIESLDIPDDYGFMDPELQRLIREGAEFYLEQMLETGADNQ